MKYTEYLNCPDLTPFVHYCVEDIVDYLNKQEVYEKMEPEPEAPCFTFLVTIIRCNQVGMSYRASAKVTKEILHNGRAYRELWEFQMSHKRKDYYAFDDE